MGEAMSRAATASKGQVEIPADIRTSMGLSAGERVVFTPLDDGSSVMRAKTRSILELMGMFELTRRNNRKVSIQDMNIGRS